MRQCEEIDPQWWISPSASTTTSSPCPKVNHWVPLKKQKKRWMEVGSFRSGQIQVCLAGQSLSWSHSLDWDCSIFPAKRCSISQEKEVEEVVVATPSGGCSLCFLAFPPTQQPRGDVKGANAPGHQPAGDSTTTMPLLPPSLAALAAAWGCTLRASLCHYEGNQFLQAPLAAVKSSSQGVTSCAGSSTWLLWLSEEPGTAFKKFWGWPTGYLS